MIFGIEITLVYSINRTVPVQKQEASLPGGPQSKFAIAIIPQYLNTNQPIN